MRHIKKMMAALVVAVLAMTMCAGAAFADVAEKTIKIDGLSAGDTVQYYKVVEWAADGSGWKFLAPFDTALSADQQKEIVGYVKTEGTTKTVVEGKITDTTATAMGGATLGTAVNGTGDTVSGTTWTATNVAPGLYMALITGAAPTNENEMVVYNPVFLAVQADNAGSEIALPLSYADNGTAKKSTVTVDKKAKDSAGNWVDTTSENVGDIIDFKVETTVPAYLESWTNPVFTVTDTLSDGLTLAVKEGEGAAALSDITVKNATKTLSEGTTGDYTITKSENGYTITFTDTYLKSRNVAELVTIEYKAKITSEAKTVNPETNTVKIEYSKSPTTSSDHGTKEDKTTHYTFSIDADLFGSTTYESSEIIKVGVDEAGNPVTTTETTYDNGEKHMPLADAEFKLFKADGTTPYTNSTITADTVFTTNDEGKLMVKGGSVVGIHGLEEGTYVLKETKAPTGYMLMTTPVTFIIEATYEDVPATATCNAYKQLASYKVTVDGTEVSNYTMNNGEKKIALDNAGHAGDVTHEIKNVKGTSLPSTGGMGTTILYVVGGIMVLLAAVWLITKRRMSKTEIEEEK